MKDLFEELGDIFKPHFEKFEKLHEDLKQNIQKGIIEDLMNCKTIAEINAIEARDKVFFKEWIDCGIWHKYDKIELGTYTCECGKVFSITELNYKEFEDKNK